MARTTKMARPDSAWEVYRAVLAEARRVLELRSAAEDVICQRLLALSRDEFAGFSR